MCLVKKQSCLALEGACGLDVSIVLASVGSTLAKQRLSCLSFIFHRLLVKSVRLLQHQSHKQSKHAEAFYGIVK